MERKYLEMDKAISHQWKPCVILDGVKSDTEEVMSGVPQGTVLGLLLFLCFIIYPPESILSSDTKLFVDDSMLFKIMDNDADRQLLQRDLSALECWEEAWQMSLNSTKSVLLRISSKKKKACQTTYQLH